jgi:hypothetical protein
MQVKPSPWAFLVMELSDENSYLGRWRFLLKKTLYFLETITIQAGCTQHFPKEKRINILWTPLN